MIKLFYKKSLDFSSKSGVVSTNTKKEIDNPLNTVIQNIGETRTYPAADTEWVNSVYSYNNNTVKTLPISDTIVNNLLKSYFNLTRQVKERSSRAVIRSRRRSLNRILVSKAEMKHTNNNVIITVYLYNKNKKFFLNKLRNIYKLLILKKKSGIKTIYSKKYLNSKVSKYKMKKPFTLNKNKKINSKKNYISRKKIFSTKRSKRNNPQKLQSILNTSHYVNFSKKTRKNLSKFISPLNLKYKYKTIVEKYYATLNKYKFYSISDINYYLSLINWNKDTSKYKSNYIDTSNIFKLFINKCLKTKRNNNYKNILQSNSISNYSNFINKSRNSRKIKNFMYKLRNYSELFFHSKTSAGEILFKNNLQDSGLNSNSFFQRNMSKILKVSLVNKAQKKMKLISLKGLRILKKARYHKDFIFKTLKWNNKSFISYETKYYKNFIRKSYRKELLYLYYVKLLSFNNNKFKNWFLLGLKKIISKVYQKKVIFNFVNLKYLHLNSDIFSESIAVKLRNRENRLLLVLKKALKLVKIPSFNKLSISEIALNNTYNTFINKYKSLNVKSVVSFMLEKNDVLHELLNNMFPKPSRLTIHSRTNNGLEKDVLNSIKYKAVYGVRLEASGRLSKRLTASRSVFKLRYKGGLKNIDSSFKNLSTVMLRGIDKPNVQYTKIFSKTRNGSFGLKGWVSGI